MTVRTALLACALAAACTTNTTYNYGSNPADAAGSGTNAHADAPTTDGAPHADAPTADAALVDAPLADAHGSPDAHDSPDAHVPPDAAAPPDAPLVGDSTSCGHPLPTTAPAVLSFTGGVYDEVTTSGVVGATVALYARGGGTPLASATTDAQAQYSFTVSTGGAPIDGYVRVTAPGHVTTDIYPAVPYVADLNLGLPVVDQNTFVSLSMWGQAMQDPKKAFFLAGVSACNGQPLAGATLTLDPAGTATINYPNADSNSGVWLSSTSTNGNAIVQNVTPGDVLVDGTAGATSLRGHVIEARTDELTIVLVTP